MHEVYANPEQYFDQVIEINLSELGPLLNGPFTPDLSTEVGSEMTEKAKANDWPIQVEWGLNRFLYKFILRRFIKSIIYCTTSFR